jgi:hypothetical protein
MNGSHAPPPRAREAQVEDVAVAKTHRNRWFADSPLEESGFEPLVPLLNRNNRGTGPMSPTASIRVAY